MLTCPVFFFYYSTHQKMKLHKGERRSTIIMIINSLSLITLFSAHSIFFMLKCLFIKGGFSLLTKEGLKKNQYFDPGGSFNLFWMAESMAYKQNICSETKERVVHSASHLKISVCYLLLFDFRNMCFLVFFSGINNIMKHLGIKMQKSNP